MNHPHLHICIPKKCIYVFYQSVSFRILKPRHLHDKTPDQLSYETKTLYSCIAFLYLGLSFSSTLLISSVSRSEFSQERLPFAILISFQPFALLDINFGFTFLNTLNIHHSDSLPFSSRLLRRLSRLFFSDSKISTAASVSSSDQTLSPFLTSAHGQSDS